MDKALHRNFQVKVQSHLIDFPAADYLRHACACLLGTAAAFIVWSIFPHKSDPHAANVAHMPQPAMHDWNSVALHVSSAHLFGQDARSAIVAITANPSNIMVQGLVYSDDKDSALAILSVDGNSGFFRIGDVLTDGETLLAIAPTAIQLGNGGMTRVIELQQDSGGRGDGIMLAGDTGLSSPHRVLFPGEMPAASQAPYAPALRTVSVSSTSDPLSQLQSLRQQLIKH